MFVDFDCMIHCNKMDEELLISMVANYKELYDPQHPKYDDNQRRNNIWEEIGGVLKQSGMANIKNYLFLV